MDKPPLGSGGRFAELKSKLASRPGVSNPGALAAYIGRKKYGKSRFAQLGAKGRGSVRHKIGHPMAGVATGNDNEIGHSTPANKTLGAPNRPEGTAHGGNNAKSPRGQPFGTNRGKNLPTRQDLSVGSGTKPARTLTSTGGDGVVY